MHLSIDTLLALRDGDRDPRAAAHLDGCEHCRHELAQLAALTTALQELPEQGPAADQWPIIVARLQRRRRRAVNRLLLAAAALVLAATAVLVMNLGPAPQTNTAEHEATGPDQVPVTVAELRSASRELERMLRSSALRNRVVTPRQAAVIVAIEDSIALVDAQLADTPIRPANQAGDAHLRSQGLPLRLWIDRVELLQALVEVHQAEPAAFAACSVVLAGNRSSHQTGRHPSSQPLQRARPANQTRRSQ